MNEDGERLIWQGPRGLQGNQGERGAQGRAGLSAPVRRALVFLFVLSVVLAGANMLWTAYEVRASNQARCASVLADATIPLPRLSAGSVSREWEAVFEANARQRAKQLGCTQ